jgi:pyrroloquinoline quinone (PQQ) biosynthesis protein C
MEFRHKQLEEARDALAARLLSHSFLRRCRDGDISQGELMIFLVQHGLYSANFTKFLCAAMANLPGNEELRLLAQNLFDECGFSGTKPHAVIYGEMPAGFGLTLKDAAPLSGTSKLIATMFRHCRSENPAHGTGALNLGAEALVPFFYTGIVTGLLRQGVSEEDLSFFTLHIAVDDGHATTLAGIQSSLLDKNPGALADMVAAGNDLVDARLAFFDSIEEAARSSPVA